MRRSKTELGSGAADKHRHAGTLKPLSLRIGIIDRVAGRIQVGAVADDVDDPHVLGARSARLRSG